MDSWDCESLRDVSSAQAQKGVSPAVSRVKWLELRPYVSQRTVLQCVDRRKRRKNKCIQERDRGKNRRHWLVLPKRTLIDSTGLVTAPSERRPLISTCRPTVDALDCPTETTTPTLLSRKIKQIKIKFRKSVLCYMTIVLMFTSRGPTPDGTGTLDPFCLPRRSGEKRSWNPRFLT